MARGRARTRLGGAIHRSSREIVDDRAQGSPQLGVSELPVDAEGLVGGEDREARVENVGADDREHLSELGLCAYRAEQAGTGADNGNPLVRMRS